MKTKNLSSLLCALGLGLAVASPPASAAIEFFFPTTSFQDDDLDFVFDNNNNNVIDVGDRLLTVFEYVNTQGTLPGQGPTPIGPEELTGVIDLTVVGVDPVSGALLYAPSGAAGVLSGFAAGTAAVLWTDATPDLNVINAACGDRADCLALAGLGGTDGSTLYLSVGFFGDPDVNIFSTGIVPLISDIEDGAADVIQGSLNYFLQVGPINNTGFTFGPRSCGLFCGGPGGDGFVQVTGSGSLLGGETLDHEQWTGRSDNDSSVNPQQVPEPASLALVGLAIAGLGVMRRRNRTAG